MFLNLSSCSKPAAPGDGGRRRLLRGGLALLGVGLGLASAPLRAWDAARMLQSARAMGAQTLEGARALAAVLQDASGRDEPAQLRAVNDFYNRRIVFMDDIDSRGVVDDWASPLELISRGVGDCEDYAIAKYFSLTALGLPARRLRLVYVRAMVDGASRAHMVLAHYASPSADPLILDNLVAEVLPASRRPDLTPVFSFNGEGLWRGTSGPAAGDPTARLSRWRDVLAKARAEGFP